MSTEAIQHRAGTNLSRRGFLSAALKGVAAVAVAASSAAQLASEVADALAEDASMGHSVADPVKEYTWQYVAEECNAASLTMMALAAGLVHFGAKLERK